MSHTFIYRILNCDIDVQWFCENKFNVVAEVALYNNNNNNKIQITCFYNLSTITCSTDNAVTLLPTVSLNVNGVVLLVLEQLSCGKVLENGE